MTARVTGEMTGQASGEEPGGRSHEVIPVLFIAGAPRSGSTLLERVIGTHEGLCCVGESHFIWERSYGENQLCGCGTPFHECDFWAEVSRRTFAVDPAAVDEIAATKQKQAVDRKRYLPWLLLGYRPARYQASLLAYGELLKRLYGAILEVSGARVIVDSSKDPRHGIILAQLPGFEVHVVHLLRDPRAVAFSWTRRKRRPEIHWTDADMPTERVCTTATRWSTHNALVELLARKAASYCRLRYEDFVADPDGALAQILTPHPWASAALEHDPPVVLKSAHTVAGNPMRFDNGPLRIKLDDEWREAMPYRDRWWVTAATWPLLARYGYPLRSRA